MFSGAVPGWNITHDRWSAHNYEQQEQNFLKNFIHKKSDLNNMECRTSSPDFGFIAGAMLILLNLKEKFFKIRFFYIIDQSYIRN